MRTSGDVTNSLGSGDDIAMKALLISPYHAESHKIWAQEVMAMCPQFSWQLASLPPRFFDWRIRGNALALKFEPQFRGMFVGLDLIVATSMTDLAALKGLCPEIHNVPCAVYFHENQFAYPINKTHPRSRALEAKLVTLYGALAADLVLFNSSFNYQTFIKGARAMLKEFPDHAPLSCIEQIEQKSKVLPVPVASSFSPVTDKTAGITSSRLRGPLKIAWNHRWEYDKGPERLTALIELVSARGLNCQFSIFGQRFRQVPASFSDLVERFPTVIEHCGYVEERQKYYAMLKNHHVVLSTALHDFQGLSVLEAVRLGCLPLVPDRLAYREYLPESCRYPSHLSDINVEANAALSCLEALNGKLEEGDFPQVPDISSLSRAALEPQYRDVFDALLVNGFET